MHGEYCNHVHNYQNMYTGGYTQMQYVYMYIGTLSCMWDQSRTQQSIYATEVYISDALDLRRIIQHNSTLKRLIPHCCIFLNRQYHKSVIKGNKEIEYTIDWHIVLKKR